MINLFIDFIIWLLSMWIVLVTTHNDEKISEFILIKCRLIRFLLPNKDIKFDNLPYRKQVYVYNKGEKPGKTFWDKYELIMIQFISIIIILLFILKIYIYYITL